MNFDDDIAFLETFRDAITRFLIVGAAPTLDPLWGGTGLIEMREAMKIEEFRDLRGDINQSKGRAALILSELGVVCTFNQFPPPAVGGAVVKFPLFDLITDNRSQHSIDGSVFTDKLDEAIGFLLFKSSEQSGANSKGAPLEALELGRAIPCLLVCDLAVAVSFYRDRLGFETQTPPMVEGVTLVLIQRGTTQLLLKLSAEGAEQDARAPKAAWSAFIQTANPDALHATFEQAGADIQFYNNHDLKGFLVRDPDNNCLFFGHFA